MCSCKSGTSIKNKMGQLYWLALNKDFVIYRIHPKLLKELANVMKWKRTWAMETAGSLVHRKIMELVYLEAISKHRKDKKGLRSNQHGFTDRKATTDQPLFPSVIKLKKGEQWLQYSLTLLWLLTQPSTAFSCGSWTCVNLMNGKEVV